MEENFIKNCDEGLILKIKIVPNSSKNQIMKENEGIKIKITAQPIENKANKAVIEFLSKLVKLPKSNITILKGATSKEKTILLKTNEQNKKDEILKIFNEIN